MTKAAFRQADMERIIRAAESRGATVQIDIRSLVVTVIPAIHKPSGVDPAGKSIGILSSGNLAPDGKEHFDED